MSTSSIVRGTFSAETQCFSDVTPGPESPPDAEEEGALHVDDANNEEPLSPRNELRGEKKSDKFQLQDDIFALLFVSPFRSQAFVYSVFWFVFQSAVIALIAFDMLKDAPEDNWLKVPSAVHPAVSTAQVFALAVAVISQDDVISTLALVSVGYDEDRVPQAASRFKWILSNVCRCSIGLASLFISFLFVVQSEGVLDLFKDFAAMAFVSEIDDAAFALAKRGFLTDTLEEATRGLENIEFESKEDTINFSADGLHISNITSKAPISVGTSAIPKPSFLPSAFKARLRRILLLALFALLLAFWGVTYSAQKSGKFICQSLSVRFGDENLGLMHYSYFSGTYELGMAANGHGKEIIALRAVYYERGEKSNRKSGKFFYCLEERAWVFGVEGINKGESDEGCKWLLRSPETESFDLSDVSSSGWSIWTGTVQNAESFLLLCNVCNSDADCNYHGSCNRDGLCDCDPGWRGDSCQLESFCDVVQLYEKSEWLRDYSLLRDNSSEPILIYDRPVYFSEDDKGVDAFVYTGRRWYYIVEMEVSNVIEQLSKPFFHAHWEHLYNEDNLEAYSLPTESSMPTGTDWFVVSGSRAMGDYGPFGFSRLVLDYDIHCKDVECDLSNVCGRYGQCANDTCVCDGANGGKYCEYSNDTFADDII